MNQRSRGAADIDLERYRIPLDVPDGGTVDEKDDLDQQDVDRIVEEVRRRGRPSLGRPGARSPVLQVRVSEPVHSELRRVAGAQGRTTSEILREALDEYLEKHPA